ncbi:MAG: TetR/AcrR family transcriptional regulator [Chloroflexota bacterium]|nr:TetR/AcrR family transcriptional regulator [Chloroflexota bacterium]
MPKKTFFNLPNEKREKILDIAITEFAENAYNAASISRIVRKAKIAKGSFYQYFTNKKDLYRYLIEFSTEERFNILKKLPVPDKEASLFDYLRLHLLSAVYFEVHKPRLSKIAYRAFIEEIPFPKMKEELQRRGTTQFFKQLLTQGLVRGDVAVWIDTDLAAFALEVIYYQLGKYFINRLNLTENNLNYHDINDDSQIQQLLSNLMDIIEAGLKNNPDQSERFLAVEENS